MQSRARERRRRRVLRTGIVLVGLVVCLALGMPLSMAGCSAQTRYRVLSKVFDGVPPPGTPPKVRRKRRIVRAKPLPSPAQTEAELAEQLEQALAQPDTPPEPRYDTYAELDQSLPKDVMGNIDWVAAVRMGLIRPRPGLEKDTPEPPLLPFNVRMDPGIPQFEVVFPHAAHTYWLRCDNCHPAIFQMRAGSNPITMAKIFQGEYCGRCHGRVAFPPQTGCPRCHIKLGRTLAR